MAKTDYGTVRPVGPEPVLSENAVTVLQSRYLVKDEQGRCIETPGEMFSRVAAVIASVEGNYGASPPKISEWHERLYNVMASLKFLPNSPTLMNAGGPSGMLSACFVLPIEDSIEGIFETIKQTALIQKAGGGTGFSLDRLRPTGDRVASSGGTTSGPISFWKVFSETTDAIQQGAFRRGANMGMMSIDHPDILKFLYAKQDLKVFTNFNISVKVPDAWMDTLEHEPSTLHVVTNPRTGRRYLLPKDIAILRYSIDELQELEDEQASAEAGPGDFFSVADVWEMIITCAHKTGDPGLAFIDRINRDNPTPSLGPIEATNPCGEQPLLPHEACTLGSINLARFVDASGGRGDIDWSGLADTVKLAVRFLDNVIDACNYPVNEIARLARGNRKIGLGVMGFADCLFMLGVPYDSQAGAGWGERIMQFINKTARQASSELADERGPFPNWADSTWRIEKNLKLRNAALTCVAPTGTISIIADCSSGIEPLYSLVFVRQVLDGTRMLQVDAAFKRALEQEGLDIEQFTKRILKAGSIQRIEQIPSRMREVFKCAYDIKPRWHIEMQAAFQKHCDAAVSKTVNLGEKAKVSGVDRAYRLAYRLGCKGITIYRRHSRPGEPMALCQFSDCT